MPMRQLRSCDFCGDDAAGVYEVLPPELSPTEAEQHRVVLCSDCVGTLEAVVNPLLERLGVDTGGDDTDPTPEGSPPPSRTSDSQSSTRSQGHDGRDPTASESSPETDTPAGISPSTTGETDSPPSETTSEDGSASPTDDEPALSEERPPSSGDEPAPSTEPFSPAEDGPSAPAADDPPRSADDDPSSPTGDDPDDSPVKWGTGDSPSTDDTPDDGPVEWGTGGSSSTDDTSDGSGSEPIHNGIPSIEPSEGTDAESETASPAPEPSRTSGADDPEPTDTGGRDAGGLDDEPEEFRTVMRLLSNREFPVERDNIVELAASAYELDDTHVRQCLDYAVDRGVIDDDGGLLRRG